MTCRTCGTRLLERWPLNYCSQKCYREVLWRRDYNARYRKRERAKWLARKKVEKALCYGKLQKGPCEVCGTTKKVEAHHRDYSKPLEVNWLCRPCHKATHEKAQE